MFSLLRRPALLVRLAPQRCPHFRSRILRFNSSDASTYNPRRERWITPTMVLLGFVPIFTLGLGTWQLQRLQWKVNLIDELEEKLQLQPLSLPNRINLSVIPEFVFRKVFLRGKWDHSHSMLVGPSTREGVHGAHVLTPLIREDGTTVIVDRGFLAKEFDLQSIPQDTNEVEVLGMLRTAQERNTFTPDNHPERGEWYWKDLDAMAEYAGGADANVQPVLIEEIFDGHEGEASARVNKGLPVGRPARVDLRNAHLSYVITWSVLLVSSGTMLIQFTGTLCPYSQP
ncbi:SURF1-like protein [Favolaschia claudopus]|uniref:SURF1-like protein n=1 Tax=Favolaschia claudopus TaxID=2862362 RepID=A0AAW0EF60_9AGAR